MLKGPAHPPGGIDAVLRAIVDHVPPPPQPQDELFRMVITMMEKGAPRRAAAANAAAATALPLASEHATALPVALRTLAERRC